MAELLVVWVWGGAVLDPVVGYASAAETVADLVGRVGPDMWNGPGLGVWDVRALVGHTSRALITVSTYLDRPVARERVDTAADYYVLLASAGGGADSDAVAERGRVAGAQLGGEPAAAFHTLAGAAIGKARAAELDMVVETIAGGMRVGTYLPTRTFELVVHGLDIADATKLPVAFDTAVLSDAVALAARVSVRQGAGVTVLRALTGRAALPTSFCIV